MQRGRVRSACERCRRQKLKCDPHLPCQLCVRSGAQCVSSTSLLGENGQERPSPTALGKRKAYALHHETAKAPRVSGPPAAGSYTEVECLSSLSSFRLVEQMFGIHGTGTASIRRAGSVPEHSLVRRMPPPDKVTIREILGHDLPAPPVVDFLVGSYLRAVHWYLPLLHEPTFRMRLNALVVANDCSESDGPFLMLGVIVLLIGLHFAPAGSLDELVSQVDVYALRRRFVASLERNFLPSFHQYNLDWISFTVLLSSYYLLNQRPRRASIVMSSAVRAALNMRFDQAVNHATMSTVEREMRKRVEWTVYIVDGFAALVAGTVPIIKPEDVTATEPIDIEDNSTRSAEFQSREMREDGSLQPVTVYSFHRYRVKFYRIASQLNSISESPRRGTDTHNIGQVYEQIDQLRAELPPELCLDSYNHGNRDSDRDETSRIFRLQALTLRVLCEHIQLLLFRPFIAHQRSDAAWTTEGMATKESNDTQQDGLGMVSLSRRRCFESARRIARIDEHPDILRMTANTPLVTHLGVVSFTSGAVLGMLALSNPVSNNARDCKIELARVINLPSICKSSNQLWDQATHILRDVLRLIGSVEIKTLLIGDFPRSPASSTEEPLGAADNSGDGEDTTPSYNEDLFHDPGTYAGPGTALLDLGASTEYYTALQDIYGPSIGLGDSTERMAMIQHGPQSSPGYHTMIQDEAYQHLYASAFFDDDFPSPIDWNASHPKGINTKQTSLEGDRLQEAAANSDFLDRTYQQ